MALAMPPPGPSLIEKMGGVEAASGLLVSAVESFYIKLISDPNLARFFEGVDMAKLKSKQVTFLAFVFGGPQHYTGKDLAVAHEHLIKEKGLNETHFDRVAGHFRDCLLELGAPEPLVAEALTILATARPIFERQPKAVPAAGPSPEDTAAIASHLQAVLLVRDQELAKVRHKVRNLAQGSDPAALERLRAALRLRGQGLVELFDQAVAAEAVAQ